MYVFNWGVGRSILEIFCEKSRGLPTSQIGLIHGPSQRPEQKHLTLAPFSISSKTEIIGSVAHITACQERNGQLFKLCQKDETTSAPLLTRRPFPGYGKLPNFHYLSWSTNPTDCQPRAQIKLCLRKVS